MGFHDRVEEFNSSSKPLIIGFLWGFLEGIFLFVVPEVIIGFVALFNWKKGIYASLSSIAGSLASAIVMYVLTAYYGLKMNLFLMKVPGISEKMISYASATLLRDGPVALLLGPLSGVPYKIYSVQSALLHVPLLEFLLYSIPARVERILPITLVAVTVGLIFRNNLRQNAKAWTIIYATFWTLIYSGYAAYLLIFYKGYYRLPFPCC